MKVDPASFRDPSGRVYESDGVILRSINASYLEDWRAAENCGLLAESVARGWLPAFHETSPPQPSAAIGLEVEKIPFISYPYEWSFSQLKDAAKLTLDLHLAALEKDMILKDASAYNVQFVGCSPKFIDMLSFERRREGAPWPAYRQFCMHFLAPLALCRYLGLWAGTHSKLRTDGVPLSHAAAMLPLKARLRPGLALHIFAHAAMEKRHADARKTVDKVRRIRMGKKELVNLALALRYLVEGMTLPAASTQWGGYYDDTNYSERAFACKQRLVEEAARQTADKRAVAMDLGANTGVFSALMAPHFAVVLAPDVDPLAVELHYASLRGSRASNILPLILDLSNPSPSLGWDCTERKSFPDRCKAKLITALALIHHLVLTEGVPFTLLAPFFHNLLDDDGTLLLEFVPEDDSQVRRMTAIRTDSLAGYSLEAMRLAFADFFHEVRQEPVEDSKRILFTYRKKG